MKTPNPYTEVSTIIRNRLSSCQNDGGNGEYLGLAIILKLAKKNKRIT
jgi:hypothetical protein